MPSSAATCPLLLQDRTAGAKCFGKSLGNALPWQALYIHTFTCPVSPNLTTRMKYATSPRRSKLQGVGAHPMSEQSLPEGLRLMLGSGFKASGFDVCSCVGFLVSGPRTLQGSE